jgi:hypothetical protein
MIFNIQLLEVSLLITAQMYETSYSKRKTQCEITAELSYPELSGALSQ